MMKKILIVLLSFCIFAAFASCTDAPAESSETDSDSVSDTEPVCESSDPPAESSEEEKIEWTLFRVTAIDDVYGKTEGACMIFTKADQVGPYCYHVAFRPAGNDTWEVVETAGAGGDTVALNVPEGGFVYAANIGNDWPSLVAQNNVKGDGATGLWYDDPMHTELPNFATKASQDAFAIAGAFKVGDVVAFDGFDPMSGEIPTSTPEKGYWEDDYVCTSYFRLLKVNEKVVENMKSCSYVYHSDILNRDITYPYRVWYPTDYDSASDKKYPLLLFLHGHGEVGTDNCTQLQVQGDRVQLLDDLVERDDCIILAPQCEFKLYEVEGIGSYSLEWANLTYRSALGSRDELPEIASAGQYAAGELLDLFLQDKKVDRDRVYISGISMGAFGTWEMLARRPGTFAAAIPLCGAGIPSTAYLMKDVAIWAFHGEADDTVSVNGTRDMEEALKAVGGNIKTTYFPGVGHWVWRPAYATEGLIDWMMAQSKK